MTGIPFKRGVSFSVVVTLWQQANANLRQSAPTLALADFIVSKDGGAGAQITDLPVAISGMTGAVLVTFTIAEATCDQLHLQCIDAAGAQWYGPDVTIALGARQTDDLAARGEVSSVDASTVINGSSIIFRRGDSLSLLFTELGSVSGYTSLWFTIKSADFHLADAQALIQIKKNASSTGDGLLYANGAAAGTAADGSITINDAAAGDLAIALQETVTDDFAPGEYRYDIQKLVSGSVTTLTEGAFTVVADVTQAVA